jgi:hypothetical protein
MLGEVDTFDFLLAEKLCKSLDEVRSWPAIQVEQWRALLRVRSEMEKLHGSRR